MERHVKLPVMVLVLFVLETVVFARQADRLTQTGVERTQPRTVQVEKEQAATPILRSGSTTSGALQRVPKKLAKLPNTVLSVKRSITPEGKWGNYWSDDVDSKASYPVIISFRWITREQGLTGASWQLSKIRDFSNIKGSGSIPVPEPGKYGFFSIDLRPYISAGGATFYVRIRPTKKGLPQSTGGRVPRVPYVLVDPSNTVTLIDQWTTPPTQFDQLPKLTVVFDKIVVKDDSDDLSAGDLAFGFWVYNQGPEYHTAEVNTDEETYPGIAFTIENPPKVIQLRVFGVDNDEIDWIPIGPFVMLLIERCGGVGPPTDECPGDAAEGTTLIETGMGTSIAKPETPFTLQAYGPVLKFVVEGRYWLEPY